MTNERVPFVKERLIAIIVILALGAGVAVLVVQKQRSPRATRERMVEQFIAILPDSLDNDHILEIRQLFYQFYEREKLGKVKPETGAMITDKLAAYVEKGRIVPHELVRFMAEVGYNTYKDEQRYNEDSTVDHPILNEKETVSIRWDSTQYDSTFWADFKKWKKDNPQLVDSLLKEFPEVLDSMTQEQYTPPGRRRR